MFKDLPGIYLDGYWRGSINSLVKTDERSQYACFLHNDSVGVGYDNTVMLLKICLYVVLNSGKYPSESHIQ